MSDDQLPTPALPDKPAVASKTMQGLLLVYGTALYVLWPIATKVLHHQGLTPEEAQIGLGASGTLLAGAFAAYGRLTSKQNIRGLFSVPK